MIPEKIGTSRYGEDSRTESGREKKMEKKGASPQGKTYVRMNAETVSLKDYHCKHSEE